MTLGGFAVELVVDTGFGGGVLIPFPLFQSLGFLSALTADDYKLVMPDSREKELYTSRQEAYVGGERFTVDVHSSPYVDRKLAGRSLLRAFVATLDGPAEELTLERPPRLSRV